MTLQEFTATRVWFDDIRKSGVPDADLYGDSPQPHGAWVYMDSLCIEQVGKYWPASARERGSWYLILGNCEYISDDLSELEARLYEYAEGEGYWATDVVEAPPLPRQMGTAEALRLVMRAAAYPQMAEALAVLQQLLEQRGCEHLGAEMLTDVCDIVMFG